MRSSHKLSLVFFLLAFFTIENVYAEGIVPTGFSLSYGKGRPNNLSGGRLALQWNWNTDWLINSPFKLTGYWDASVAYWTTNGNQNNNHKSIGALAFAPVFRFQTREPILSITPYLEASVGLAGLSSAHIGDRDLGTAWAFQDLIGAGISFGDQQQFDLSYHYLHYSNADLASHNQGIDVKVLITFAYRW